jgi:hypothetical protein
LSPLLPIKTGNKIGSAGVSANFWEFREVWSSLKIFVVEL